MSDVQCKSFATKPISHVSVTSVQVFEFIWPSARVDKPAMTVRLLWLARNCINWSGKMTHAVKKSERKCICIEMNIFWNTITSYGVLKFLYFADSISLTKGLRSVLETLDEIVMKVWIGGQSLGCKS
jgi:hypothetical protein